MKTNTNTPQHESNDSRSRRRWVLAAALGAMIPIAGQIPTIQADEPFGHHTQYYEDDAWWDVSEWFDGNDYNPTDEAIGRWDDELYDTPDALTSTDRDNDTAPLRFDFGFFSDSNDDDNWFFDYYDSGYSDHGDYDNDGYYDYFATYYDYDADGVMDSVAEYADKDRDGVYEFHNFVAFSNSNSQQDRESEARSRDEQKTHSSRVVERQGSIQLVKKVKTPRGKNLVVAIGEGNQGDRLLVDLGRADQFDAEIKKGDEVQVKGAMFKVGDKSVLLASTATLHGQQQSIDRSGRKFTGKVDDMMTAQIRGNKHELAKLQTDQGKKLLVDLGPQDRLKLDVKSGSEVSVSGPAIKVKDRMVLIAREVTVGDETMQIERMALKQ
ncbi:hypothetical protein CKO51_15220 [Rhodopirellula sp. SM50]|nr:hypothetical protein [Rhodopirellula sp. SM50]PAY18676.1 hypothetical protein CKO51_15220 [Rhodopirellula sp. SM50]